MKEYKEHGYYTRADGTKSNEGIEKPSKKDHIDDEAEPVKKKQSRARIAKNKEKEQKMEESKVEESKSPSKGPKKSDVGLLFDEDS